MENFMSGDPLDIVIGSSESAKRDSAAAVKHLQSASEFEAKIPAPGARQNVIAELRRAVAADPSNPLALFRLAYHLDVVGEEDEAVSYYERCTELAPAHVNALLNLAVLHEDRGDYLRAERCLRQVLDTNPNHNRAHLFLKDVSASKTMEQEEDTERDIFKRKAMMDTPVTDFDLSVRARTCLKKMNIRTLGDLLKITESELMSYKNFGESSLQEIRKMLQAKGLRLGQGIEDAQRANRRALLDHYKGTPQESLLGKSVSELQLSVRARKALQMLNIQSLGELASHTEAELMGIKNFGATSLKEVRDRLQEIGLGLRTLDA
jgi:DNA-directed RNA polymerase subunit alpha